MKAPGPRASFALLAVLSLVAFALPVYEAVAKHSVSAMSVVTAAMFATMLVMWPFLNGARISQGHLQHAAMCVECRTLRWPAEEALGFCLRCGSTRPAVRAGY